MLTANQTVAINLEAARRRLQWTQQQTVEQLARFGLKWTRTNYAMAISTSIRGKRVREFSADELLVFAQAFNLAVWSLFMPPPHTVVAPPGGPKLDADAVRHFVYEAGARESLSRQLREEFTRDIERIIKQRQKENR